MNPKLKSYLIIIGHLIIGMALLVTLESLKLPGWVNVSVIVCIAFVLLNLLHVFIFKLNKDAKEYWTLKKIKYLLFGFAGGVLIALAPLTVSFFAGRISDSDIIFKDGFSITSIILTLIIAGWEELWFRGIFLNYCHRYLSAVNLSVTMGLLFMLMHLLNPKIDLLSAGPALFFAGALLTLLYFNYKTIWLPIGVHFGNNIVGSFVESTKENDVFYGGDGYLSAMILAGLFFFFVTRAKRAKLPA